ncbi:lysophospholipid acyltransferase family protein [Salidesulfovibrio brasiliensis]|uniref:lysophospholipid acyltransferase family protein n=1 Tax=Salidesulfovibrio brasiliensis TaxID=221711 RepID=UPI0006D28610|nr:lysophospholipid acyltransferase family protein [Salidesulfovibrio brasiliensis]
MKIPIGPTSLSPLLYHLHRFWCRSMRYDGLEYLDQLADLQRQGIPTVVAGWHDEIFPLTGCTYLNTINYVLFVSQSKDGEVISRVLERMGHATARGSSSRGGVRALLHAKRLMQRENRVAVFTVDGPRGPRHESKDGPIFLAHRAEAVIFPLRAFCDNRYVFEKSWDRFQVPYPFSRVRLRAAEPYRIEPEELNEEVLQKEKRKLEDRLNSLQP